MRINGETVEILENENLQKLLVLQGYDIMKTAVELNGEIISKEKYADTEIDNNAVIEVVTFVGGG